MQEEKAKKLERETDLGVYWKLTDEEKKAVDEGITEYLEMNDKDHLEKIKNEGREKEKEFNHEVLNIVEEVAEIDDAIEKCYKETGGDNMATKDELDFARMTNLAESFHWRVREKRIQPKILEMVLEKHREEPEETEIKLPS